MDSDMALDPEKESREELGKDRQTQAYLASLHLSIRMASVFLPRPNID